MDWVTKRKASKHEEGMKAWGEKWGALPIKRELQLSRVEVAASPTRPEAQTRVHAIFVTGRNLRRPDVMRGNPVAGV